METGEFAMQASSLEFDRWSTAIPTYSIPELKISGSAKLDLSQFDGLTQRNQESLIFQDSMPPQSISSTDMKRRLLSRRSNSSIRRSVSINTSKCDDFLGVEQQAFLSKTRRDHTTPCTNVTRRSNICRYDGGCRRRAIFGDPHDKPPRYAMFCAQHRRPTDRDVANRVCNHLAGCQQPAYFGPTDGGPERFCSAHRLACHVNLRCARRSAVPPESLQLSRLVSRKH